MQKGFTLIELMVVIVIIGIIGSVILGIVRKDHAAPSAPTIRAADENIELITPTPAPATPAKEEK
ncbi:prepilin-type N-terminal cleavage/methylation domain-containing protein [Acinetobacter sp.]|uniref:prepilin-type N-terminal cleavage/methylation domain-containing protein n=1 Tax=Acinetobacter sp. TaxID=472 RepID=UPI00388FBB4E